GPADDDAGAGAADQSAVAAAAHDDGLPAAARDLVVAIAGEDVGSGGHVRGHGDLVVAALAVDFDPAYRLGEELIEVDAWASNLHVKLAAVLGDVDVVAALRALYDQGEFAQVVGVGLHVGRPNRDLRALLEAAGKVAGIGDQRVERGQAEALVNRLQDGEGIVLGVVDKAPLGVRG